MKLKKLSFLAAGIAAAVFNAFPVQASSVINAVPQVIQAESSVTAGNTVTYFGSEVLEAYTYNPEKYTYHKISDSKQLSLLIKLLESGKTKSPKAETEGGFLLVTANGKHEIYIDSQEKELLTLCRNNNAVSPGLVQWLVFMSTDRITTATHIGPRYNWDLRTDERWAISEVSALLKSLKVDKTQNVTTKPEDHKNPPMGGKPIFLRFNTGVGYRIDFGDIGETYLSIRSSDMNYSISYSLQKGECDRLLQGLKQIEEKNPTHIFSISKNIKPENITSINASGSMQNNSFHIDTSNAQKIENIYNVLCTMRVYKEEYVGDTMVNPITSPQNGFTVGVSLKNGEQWVFQAEDRQLAVYKNKDESYTRSSLTQNDYQAFYDALSRAAR